MAIRYAGIEFDTVEELVQYKRLMEGRTEKKLLVVHEQAKPINHEHFGKIQKGKGRKRNHKASDEKVVELIKNMKRKLCLTRIWEKLGYKGGMRKDQKQRLDKLIADNNLQDRIKRRMPKSIVPTQTPEKAVKYAHIEVNEKQRIRELCESGLSIKQIAMQTGRSHTAVYKLCKEIGRAHV